MHAACGRLMEYLLVFVMGFQSEAYARLRNSFLDEVQNYLRKHRLSQPSALLDVGCSAGMSTISLAQAFPRANKVVGLDLSPHFLALAKYRQERGEYEDLKSGSILLFLYIHTLPEYSLAHMI